MIDVLYLSPHLDDAVYSCGGAIYDQLQAGQRVLVVTVCAGLPPTQTLSNFAASLHDRWEVSATAAVNTRRAEDRHALRLLGARWLHLPVPDCIYRAGPTGEWLYASEESLFGLLHPSDRDGWANRIIAYLSALPGLHKNTQIWLPLAIGEHVDHQLVRYAAEQWVATTEKQNIFHYEDFPYAVGQSLQMPVGWQRVPYSISPAAITARIAAMAAYKSQLSTFWADESDLARSVQQRVMACGEGPLPGECIWQKHFTST